MNQYFIEKAEKRNDSITYQNVRTINSTLFYKRLSVCKFEFEPFNVELVQKGLNNEKTSEPFNLNEKLTNNL